LHDIDEDLMDDETERIMQKMKAEKMAQLKEK